MRLVKGRAMIVNRFWIFNPATVGHRGPVKLSPRLGQGCPAPVLSCASLENFLRT